MPLYLAPYHGSGTPNDPFLPVGSSQPGWSAIDLRADGGATLDGSGFGSALLWLPLADANPKLTKLADALDEPLSRAVQALMTSRSAVDVSSDTTPIQMIARLLKTPPINGWRALQPAISSKFIEIHLGGTKIFSEVAVTGGGGTSGVVSVTPQFVADDFVRIPARRARWLWWLGYAALAAILSYHAPEALSALVVLTTATDDFNRADANPIGGSWTTIGSLGAVQIVTNQAIGTIASGWSAAAYSGAAAGADQFSQATYATSISNARWGTGVRMKSSTTDVYAWEQASSSPGWGKWVGGSFSGITTWTGTASVGDVWKATVAGSSLAGYLNGAAVSGANGGTATDTSISAAGDGPGLVFGESTGGIDSWSGGDLSSGTLAGFLVSGPVLKSLVHGGLVG